MFTGLVETVGEVVGSEPLEGGGRRLIIAHQLPGEDLVLGESIAVNGACLTVVDFQRAEAHQQQFSADLSPETLHRTTLGHLVCGAQVNLERSVRVGDRLGGHLVTGHVDGVATVAQVTTRGDMTEVYVDAPTELSRFIAEKGSVTLAGVSLTVNGVEGARFSVQLIPHTRAVTTLGLLVAGDHLNIEVDLVARYVQRLMTTSA